MNTLAFVASGLNAALRLARGQPDGASLVADDGAATASSFWAILLCLPTVVCRVLMAWVGNSPPARAGHEIARELVVFVLGWLIFVELSHAFAGAKGLSGRWWRFIALWNWCNVIEGVLVVAGGIPGLLGAPSVVDETCQVVTLGWALWLEWYVTRLTLGIGRTAAIGLVILDQAIGLVLGSLALTLSG